MSSIVRPRDGAPRWIAALALLAALFALLQFVLPGHWPHPVRADDYANVGSTFADIGPHWKRPVSANLIFLVAGFGVAASYLFLSALAVLDAMLVWLLAARVFAVRMSSAGLLAMTLAFGIIVFSHASAFVHATYLGLLTNLISHVFGLATLFALWRGWRDPRARWWLLAALTYLLTALAKEDFLPPPLLLLAWLAVEDWRADMPAVPTTARTLRWAGAAALLMIGVGTMLWHAHDHNPFVAGLFAPERSSPSYAVELSPLSVLRGMWKLTFGFAPVASAAAVLAALVLCWRRPGMRLRVLWWLATVASLILPYALLSHNMPPFRVYAWLPWLASLTVVAIEASVVVGTNASPRRRVAVVAVAAVAVALAIAWAQHPARATAVAGYAHDVAINRRIVATLQRERAAISGAPAVGLVGLGDTSPWCAQDAAYVNGKLGFDNRWIVFVPRPNRCYTQQARDVRRKRGIHVSVVPLDTLCSRGALPVIEYAADGSGRLRRADDGCDAVEGRPVPAGRD